LFRSAQPRRDRTQEDDGSGFSLSEVYSRVGDAPEQGRDVVRLAGISMITKMIVVTALLLLAASVAGGISSYLVAASAIEREIEFTAQQVVASLAGSITTVIKNPGAAGELQIALNKVLREDDEGRVVDAYILDKTLVVLAAKDTQAVGTQYSGGLLGEQFRSVGILDSAETHTTVAAPVQWGKKKRRNLGYVVFSFSQGAVKKARNEIVLQFVLIFLIAFACTILFTRTVLKYLLRPVVTLGRAAYELAKGNYTFPIADIGGKDELAMSTRSFIKMREAQQIFVHFSNPALVRKILGGIAHDKAEEAKLTISFGDGVSFTSWSSAHTAAEISGMLTDYFTLAGKLVDAHNGIVEKFIGDCIMSYFGLDEESTTTAARNAILALVCTQHVFNFSNYAFKRYHNRVPLQFRFGAASGKCVVGPMGAKGVKLDYTLVGSPVNLASRLESLAPAGGIVIDRFTYLNAGGDAFLSIKHTEVKHNVKGFEDVESGIRVLHVGNLSGAAQRAMTCEFLFGFLQRKDVQDILQLSDEQQREFLARVKERLDTTGLELPAQVMTDE